jgi:hypothetical protein
MNAALKNPECRCTCRDCRDFRTVLMRQQAEQARVEASLAA